MYCIFQLLTYYRCIYTRRFIPVESAVALFNPNLQFLLNLRFILGIFEGGCLVRNGLGWIWLYFSSNFWLRIEELIIASGVRGKQIWLLGGLFLRGLSGTYRNFVWGCQEDRAGFLRFFWGVKLWVCASPFIYVNANWL